MVPSFESCNKAVSISVDKKLLPENINFNHAYRDGMTYVIEQQCKREGKS